MCRVRPHHGVFRPARRKRNQIQLFVSHRPGERAAKMWETRSVNLNVRLPRDVARKAEAVQESDPEFLSRVLIGGLTRRSIYEHLKEHEESLTPCAGEAR